MHITNDNRLKKLIVIGDRLLIKLTKPDERTASGLYLPPGVQEKEKGWNVYTNLSWQMSIWQKKVRALFARDSCRILKVFWLISLTINLKIHRGKKHSLEFN